MKTKFISIITIVLLSIVATTNAQTALPYFTGFDNANQKAGWQMFRKGNSNSTYEWGYTNIDAYSPTECLYHDYPVGQSTLRTDDWYVSPPFTIGSNGKIDSIRTSFRGFGAPGEGDTVAIYLLKGNADPALASSKTLLYDYRGDKYLGGGAWNITPSITLPATTGTCYIAIRYTTIVNWLDVRFDNIKISGTATTSVHDKRLAARNFVTLYPNPAKDRISMKSTAAIIESIIYDVQGRQVYRGQSFSELNIAQFPNGIYTLRCLSKDGAEAKVPFVKQ